MRLSFLPITAALLFAQISCAQGYAVLGHAFATGRSDKAVVKAAVDRARAALGRLPAAIAQLHTEGTLPGKGVRDVSLRARQDQAVMLDLAIAWRMTGDRAFLDQAARYLDNWASTYRLSFNPIDETGFDRMIMACDLTGSDLPDELRARLDGFWRRMAAGYLDAMEGHVEHASNNWQSHRVKLATMAAFQTGDRNSIDRARAAYRKQIAANLRPDGSTLDFEERDALHYVTYDLEPLSMAALAAMGHGEDWYGWRASSGASLPRALDWLVPYARGAKTHMEFVHSKVRFDRERAASGQAEYAPHLWKPTAASHLYQIASLLDPRFETLGASLGAQQRRPPEAWVALFGGGR